MRRGWWLMLVGAASVAGYALWLNANGLGGFPLDDAWIHQTYARNLGLHGQWAFTLNQPSAGSTAPLWTALLALGYWLGVDHALWTFALNAALLGATAWLAYALCVTHALSHRQALLVGALLALEWHLVWAAGSGMETLLFCALSLAAWLTAQHGAQTRWAFVCGLIVGLSVWTRPDGFTILPFGGWALWQSARGKKWQRLLALAVGSALLVVPYFIFNVALSGHVFPNTYFAKQTEYAILQQLPLWQRIGQVATAPLVGVLAVAIVGVLPGRRLPWLAWCATFLLAYALRLPVTYQHGRYLIPIIPTLLVMSGMGIAKWVRADERQIARRIAGRAWLTATVAVAVGFWLLGARAIVTDVQVIESRMVRVAKWAAVNIVPGTLVAAHDIGALGYFANVRLADLAGLVSPEVIPHMGDDSALWHFVQASGAEFFINYPGWCPAFLTDDALVPVFQTGELCTPQDPNLEMTVYRINH